MFRLVLIHMITYSFNSGRFREDIIFAHGTSFCFEYDILTMSGELSGWRYIDFSNTIRSRTALELSMKSIQ